jgi:hypothetical protein
MAAIVTILRETDREAVIQITAAEILSAAVVLLPTALNNDGVNPVLSVQKVAWAVSGTNKASLLFHGSSNKLIGTYAGNGRMDYWQDFQSKIINDASGTNGSLLLTTTTNDAIVLIIKLEKTSGFTKANYYTD